MIELLLAQFFLFERRSETFTETVLISSENVCYIQFKLCSVFLFAYISGLSYYPQGNTVSFRFKFWHHHYPVWSPRLAPPRRRQTALLTDWLTDLEAAILTRSAGTSEKVQIIWKIGAQKNSFRFYSRVLFSNEPASNTTQRNIIHQPPTQLIQLTKICYWVKPGSLCKLQRKKQARSELIAVLSMS